MKIHIFWDGPFGLDSLNELTDDEKDYGLYQIYGQHPLYGHSVLLYLGKADAQTLGKRIGQRDWNYWHDDSRNIEVYVGRLAEKEKISMQDWSIRIDIAEKMLINAHSPAYNTQNGKNLPIDIQVDHHILNWGQKRDLFPEISGLRFSSHLDYLNEFINPFVN